MLEIELTEYAEEDILDSFLWYNNELTGLGDDFLSYADQAFRKIIKNPVICPVIIKDIHRKMMLKYPFAIFFEILPDKIMVYGVIHASRNPETLLNRVSEPEE
jgi:toxin ParE1/3/4